MSLNTRRFGLLAPEDRVPLFSMVIEALPILELGSR